jgi:hypothetical protein
MDDPSVSRASAAHAARLDWTIQDLQNRIIGKGVSAYF